MSLELSKAKATDVALGFDLYAAMERTGAVVHFISDEPHNPVHTFGIGVMRGKTNAVVLTTLLSAAGLLNVLGENELAESILARANQIAAEGQANDS